ncbi:NAD(P)-dependent oxidoreductase [Pseudomonas umsongensis]|uniref:NAD(P)-dependent oxidoreductase n=1 Tax=Pseudomonas umsongensis TaxID=198618 RepID=A0AAE6ZVU7_9PSED|nr:NAD(P)-binding domain-containing protein [Pseudomonas umsongensis]QJC80372.1 NAD(P)-dependent oxidoreductase [Pseudomonas umsongensis]
MTFHQQEGNGMKHSKATFIGLGQMGAALVPPFIDAGLQVTVWNRSAAKAAPLVALGAKAAADFITAVSACDLIIVCLADYATSNALFHRDEITPLLKGKTIVQLTTGDGREAEFGALWAAEAGVNYLDGAIMDYPTKVGDPECLLLVSGDRAVWDSCEAQIKLLGGRMTYVGSKPSSANLLDGSLLTMYYGNTFALMQSAAMLEAEQVDLKDFKTALNAFKPVIESTWKRTIEAIDQQDYSGNEASIHVHSLGVQSLLKRAKNSGVEHSLLQLFSEYVDQTAARGHEADELPAAFEVLRRKG